MSAGLWVAPAQAEETSSTPQVATPSDEGPSTPQIPQPHAPATATTSPTLLPFSGDISFSYSSNRTSYHSDRLTAGLDLTYQQFAHELLTEIRIDREEIKLPDADARSVSLEEYDASLKWKYFDRHKAHYLYASPRLRHNRFTYYKNSQAIRVGIGRRLLDAPISLDMEIGTGYRHAQGHDGEEVRQPLRTITMRFAYDFTQAVSARINLVSERAFQDHYTTVNASLTSPLLGRLHLKYEMSYRRIFPFDSGLLTSETSHNLGLAYQI